MRGTPEEELAWLQRMALEEGGDVSRGGLYVRMEREWGPMAGYFSRLQRPDPARHPECWGHTSDTYIEYLYALTLHEHPQLFVELGTYRGYSTNAIAEAMKVYSPQYQFVPQLITVDMHEDHDYQPPPHLAPFVRVAVADVGDAAARDQLMQTELSITPRPIDCLFIDADHQYESVARDYECWKGLVRPGGLILFHDIRPLFGHIEGSARHWEEIRAAFPDDTDMIDECQMGALRVRG